jgi:hypothetical protein
MDLRHLLNPAPESNEPPRIIRSDDAIQRATRPGPPSSGNLHSRLYLSPRRLDPEVSSVSTNSSSKRRRTNRGRIDIDRNPAGQSAAMGRSFSELEVPSDSSSSNEDQHTIKYGVAELSLLGIPPRRLLIYVDEYASLRLGTRVEALKPGTQGTWYIARIVEFASFPAYYFDVVEGENTPSQLYPMVCVHYEGQLDCRHL